jgi:aminopeptidase N
LGYAQQDPKRQVAGDVANSLAFFTNVFGPPLFKHYYATEIPYGHGQAFPGLIHLSWWTFQSVSVTAEDEIFRAHEMAHQWWGIGVEAGDYRDAWLSEGFSDFAGMWYMQLILNDNDKYFKQLGDWARQLRSAQDDAPPMGIGYRVAQVDPVHYELMVYRKGAWVVHMLRNMLLEFRTMKEDRFRAMMRDFYTTYRGRRASTRDFQRVVEKHVGLPMDWFFDQWVSGTAIPVYTLSWRTDPAPDGKVLLRFRVRQENVPDTFIMPVPLLIELPDKSQVLIRVNMRGSKVEGELPLSAKPVRLELNPLQSVLAEVRVEGWK